MRQLFNWFIERFAVYKWFPDYFATLRQTWVDVAWGAGVPAVLFIIVWSLGYDIPRWGIAAFFVWAVIMAGYHSWRVYHLCLIPRFEVRRIVHLQDTPVVNALTGDVVGAATYYQLLPHCLTEADVDNCRGHLTSIFRWDEVYDRWHQIEGETMFLEWSHGGEYITLHPQAERRLNLFQIPHTLIPHIRPCVMPFPARFEPPMFDIIVGSKSTLRFDVRVTAKDCPAASLSVKVSQSKDDPLHPTIEVS